jgi:hypothetical protein
MARSRDWDELQYVWFEWRRRTGQKIRDLFEQMAHVSNKAAQLNSEFSSKPDHSHSHQARAIFLQPLFIKYLHFKLFSKF